jgi:hypothetical protein
MGAEPFATALRAEIEALVARYEALCRAHAQALEAARGRHDEQARRDKEALEREAERWMREAESAAARAAALEERVADLEARLARAEGDARALGRAFAQESAFVAAAATAEPTSLGEALRGAFGGALEAAPAAYASLKERRPDAVLASAIKERGRSAAHSPLSATEAAALEALARAAGCELIAPAPGVRFSSSSMDKALSVPDPAEEGNVLECLVPGLRLAGSDGALVFPRVKVAAG